MKTFFCLLAIAFAGSAQQFTATTSDTNGFSVVHLADTERGIEVDIVPSYGNRAVKMRVHGKNIFYFPYASVADLGKGPDFMGIPFLAPWANRLDASYFWANGKKYNLNPDLKNYGSDNHGLPLHGLLTQSKLWQVKSVRADAQSASVTSTLDFWKYPDLMEQWPFAQEYEMTYTLAGGALEVRTSIINRSTEPIPVVIGFHPYYRIPDKPRDEWTAHLAARQAVVTNSNMIPTGELKPLDIPNPLPLKGHLLDNGYTDLERDSSGRAHFSIESGAEKIEILFGPKFPVAILWEPHPPRGPQSEFFCIEPMTGVTDAINLAHEGKYPGLQSVQPGATWTESFWIKPSGF